MAACAAGKGPGRRTTSSPPMATRTALDLAGKGKIPRESRAQSPAGGCPRRAPFCGKT